MTEHRFLQIHYLTPYAAALLNRDDSGLAKRLPYGGVMRTRVSSQCLKRHWRKADNDPHSLASIAGFVESYRSREIVSRGVLSKIDGIDKDEKLRDAVEKALLKRLYGGKKPEDKSSRQTLLLGEPEIAYLVKVAKEWIREAGKDAKEIEKCASKYAGEKDKKFKANFAAIGKNGALPAGLAGALFGRMITSSPDANITAPVHVAHAFTVHAEESESDYFVAVDDLPSDSETGTDTIQETELASGLFYGYVAVDIGGLRDKNLGGDGKMAGEILHNLTYLIAEVSPGAKLGSTAPYSRASFMLVEAGSRQPRSLAEAFRKPSKPEFTAAASALSEHLRALDKNYATGEERKVMSITDVDIPNAEKTSLEGLASWVKTIPGGQA